MGVAVGISSLSSIVHEISKFVRFPKGDGYHPPPPPGLFGITPNILRTGYGINMLFTAKRVKMIRLQLYGSDFVNSVRKKNGGKKIGENYRDLNLKVNA